MTKSETKEHAGSYAEESAIRLAVKFGPERAKKLLVIVGSVVECVRILGAGEDGLRAVSEELARSADGLRDAKQRHNAPTN